VLFRSHPLRQPRKLTFRFYPTDNTNLNASIAANNNFVNNQNYINTHPYMNNGYANTPNAYPNKQQNPRTAATTKIHQLALGDEEF